MSDRLQYIRRARDLAAKIIDETVADQEKSRAMQSLDVLTLRHDIVMDDFDHLREVEADQADRAAAYLDEHTPSPNFTRVELLTIARGVAATSESQRPHDVLIAFQDRTVAEARALYRTIAKGKRQADIHPIHQSSKAA